MYGEFMGDGEGDRRKGGGEDADEAMEFAGGVVGREGGVGSRGRHFLKCVKKRGRKVGLG